MLAYVLPGIKSYSSQTNDNILPHHFNLFPSLSFYIIKSALLQFTSFDYVFGIFRLFFDINKVYNVYGYL